MKKEVLRKLYQEEKDIVCSTLVAAVQIPSTFYLNPNPWQGVKWEQLSLRAPFTTQLLDRFYLIARALFPNPNHTLTGIDKVYYKLSSIHCS